MPEPHAFALKTALGANELLFHSMAGREQISGLYAYQVVALAQPKRSVDLEGLLGRPAEVVVHTERGTPRVFHGLVAEARHGGFVGGRVSYRLEVVPWLWFATLAADVRVFQDKTVPDILQQVFQPYNGAFKLQLKGTYKPRAYCVQYRETDFAFASRLMEEEGIFYFFEHQAGKHTMVIADASGVHAAMYGTSSLPFREHWDERAPVAAVVEWQWSRRVQSGKVTLRDRNFLTPAETFEKSALLKNMHAQNEYEAYDYPAKLGTIPDESKVGQWATEADHQAKLRIEERQAGYARVSGRTRMPQMGPGARFQLTQHPVDAQNAEYVVLAIDVKLQSPDAEASPAGGAASCELAFTAFPAAQPFRPPRSTPRPHVAGPQTATVVGPAGEEIFTDKYGRVKVQFHWDRAGKKDEKSSCFVRVSQPAAGKGFGFVALPRIGHEVVVSFLEGDPDQPLIVGSVYNADNMPPFELPAQRAVTVLKTRSLKGGVADYNELRFDDTQGKEYLMMRAQKDRIDVVQNDWRSDVGRDVEHTVGRNLSTTIAENSDHSVGKKAALAVGDQADVDIAKDLLLKVGGAHGLTVAKDLSLDAGGSYSLKIAKDVHVKADMNIAGEAGMNLHLKAGMNVVIEGGAQLTIKAGAGSVVLGPDGVAITGPIVKINSGGAAGSGSGAKPVKPVAAQKAKKPAKLEDPLKGKHR